MSMKNASAKTLKEDLLVSFKFATRNVINFLLAFFGVLIVTVLLIAIVAAIVVPIIIFSIGIEMLAQIFVSWISTYQAMTGAAAALMILMIIIPLMAPLLVAVGALYGMGREIVESDGTTAEGVFVWYRKKFFSLAGGGIIQFLVVLAPIIVAVVLFPFYGIATGFGPNEIGIASVILGILLIYEGLVTGMLSMVYPAIIDGHSAIQAIKLSLRLSTKYIDRVLSVWFSYLSIFGLLMLPVILPAFLMSAGMVFSEWLLLYVILIAVFDIFILFPAMVIGMSRIYMILVADNVTNGEETTEFFDQASNDVGIFGGD